MANITDKTTQIRNAVYGKDIRESLASGLETISDQQDTYEEGINTRQTDLEEDWVVTKSATEDATALAIEKASFATTQGNFAKAEGEALVNTINQFNYMGEYNPLTNYQPKNMVKYNGSTYINKVACVGVTPSSSVTNWQEIATGFIIKGNYNSTKSYEMHDIVYYMIEKTLYECIQNAGTGISPYNIAYWRPILNAESMLQEINDYVNNTSSIYVVCNNNITITHNLNKYPMPKVVCISGSSYGVGGWGMGSYGGGDIIQILARAEYVDKNTVKIFLEQEFDGIPTITPISSTQYTVDFDNENSIEIELL